MHSKTYRTVRVRRLSLTLIAMTISVASKGQEIGSTNLPSLRESLLGVLKVSPRAEE